MSGVEAVALAKISLSEEQEQEVVFSYIEWLSLKHPAMALSYHVPNGANYGPNPRLRIIQATKMRRMGLKRGVPDIVIPYPRGPYHGLYIELKRSKHPAPVTDEQKWYAEGLAGVGYRVALCIGADEAIKTIAEYVDLGGFNAKPKVHPRRKVTGQGQGSPGRAKRKRQNSKRPADSKRHG